MGLKTTHGAFEGAYIAWHLLKKEVCRAYGGSYTVPWISHEDPERYPNPKWWYVPPAVTAECYPGLYAFMNSGDDRGGFTPAECDEIVIDLGRIVFLPENIGPPIMEELGGYRACLTQFLQGCRIAASRCETLWLSVPAEAGRQVAG